MGSQESPMVPVYTDLGGPPMGLCRAVPVPPGCNWLELRYEPCGPIVGFLIPGRGIPVNPAADSTAEDVPQPTEVPEDWTKEGQGDGAPATFLERGGATYEVAQSPHGVVKESSPRQPERAGEVAPMASQETGAGDMPGPAPTGEPVGDLVTNDSVPAAKVPAFDEEEGTISVHLTIDRRSGHIIRASSQLY